MEPENNSRQRPLKSGRLRILGIAVSVVALAAPIIFLFLRYRSQRQFPLQDETKLFVVSLIGLITAVFAIATNFLSMRKEPLGSRGAKFGAVTGLVIGIIAFLLNGSLEYGIISPRGNFRTPRESIINELNNLATDAYLYRIRRSSEPESYTGYAIPPELLNSHFGHYEILSVTPDSIVLHANSKFEDAGIQVVVDPDGRLSQWKYEGEYR